MKKKLWMPGIFLAVVVLFFLACPTDVRAQEADSKIPVAEHVEEGAGSEGLSDQSQEEAVETDLQKDTVPGIEKDQQGELDAVQVSKVLLWESEKFKTMMHYLLEREEVREIFESVEENAAEAFLKELNEEELYQAIILYRYSLVSEAVQNASLSESGGSLESADAEMEVRKKTDRDLDIYRELLMRMNTLQTAESDISISKQEERQELWDENAFRIFQMAVLTEENQVAESESSEAEESDMASFDDYTRYLKQKADFDLPILIQLLEDMADTEENNAQSALDEATSFLYDLYGIKSEPEEEDQGNLEEKSSTENQLPCLMSASGAGVTYRAYCQTSAWQAWSSNGGTTGGPGSNKRMEALEVKVTGDTNLGITYQTHVQKQGWMDWASDGAFAGTSGQALRMEAVRMKLTGQSAGSYDLYYRAYCETYGWLDWAKNGQSAGTVNLAKRIEALQIVLTGKGAAAPGNTGTPLRTDAVARVGSKYYTTFNSAFGAMPDGGTLYVIRSCDAEHIVTTKSFSMYPEEQNVRVLFQETRMEPAGIICTPTDSGSPTWLFGGNDGYTITFDANRHGHSGVVSSYAGTVNLKSGVRLTNAFGNGVWNQYGTTNVYDGVLIYGNGSHGIATMGNINIYGGKIYGNDYDGVRCQQTIRFSGGEIYGNRKSGVHVGEESCTFIMTGGVIHDNEYGVENANARGNIQISAGNIYGNKLDGINVMGRQMTISGSVEIHNNGGAGVVIGGGTASVTGGRIYSNPSGGIVNKSVLNLSGGEVYSNTAENGGGILNSGTLTMSGGSVNGNRASNTGGGVCILPGSRMDLSGGTVKNNAANTGKGLYHNGTALNLSGNGTVGSENDVYLCQGKFVSVTGRLNAQTAAVLTPGDYGNGRKVAECLYDNRTGSSCFKQLRLTPNGRYCLRPGDWQVSQSGAEKKDIVVSTGYPVHFNKNYDGAVQNMPGEAEKYWYEPVRLPEASPTAAYLKFRGWSENADAEKADYQPGAEVNASINKEITLYAVWGTKIKVNYVGNRDAQGEERSEYITLNDYRGGKTYTIRKNAEFTKYEGKDSSFSGWNIQPDAGAKSVRFSETQTYRLTFEQLLALAAEQQGNQYSSEAAVQEINLYAAWDEFPVITADDVLEFYEGTEVTKEMLLQNVQAKDREDGSLTQNIKIRQIEYADGKLEDGERQKGKKDQWKDDMPADYCMDTWFMQMDSEDSPVIHKITYHTVDSFGNETSYVWTVKVKYNQFPEMTAQDRYFTLEEARNGEVTYEKLLTDAVKEDRIQVSDLEDDELHPGELAGKIELIDFHEEDFKTFEESGYIVITFAVKDSMGPQGEGKETLSQCTVHVVKDGEVSKPEDPGYVRFINQDYYESNLEGGNDQNGGLNTDSRWYRNPEYKEVITAAWQEGNTSRETWTFSREEVENVKEYIKEHGIGNSQEKNALSEFAVRFGSGKKME